MSQRDTTIVTLYIKGKSKDTMTATATYILMTVAAQHKREEESGRLSKIHPSFSLWLDRRVGEEEASSK